MILSVVNNKGGVGKTTTAISTAEALAMQNKKVLIVDLDSQASATMALGISVDGPENSMAGVMLGGIPIQDVVQNTTVKGLFIAPSSIELQNVELQKASEPPLDRAVILKKALEPIKRKYDFILVDCGPSINLLLINALLAADELLIPVQPEYMALDGLRNLLTTINMLETQLSMKFKVAGILPTRVDRRTSVASQVIEVLRQKLPGKVFDVEVPTNVKLAEAPGARKPIAQYDPLSRGAQAYGMLAEELVAKTKKHKSANA